MPHLITCAPWNHSLNRLPNVIPYDTNRFHAPNAVTYINASWLLDKTTIATQAPRDSVREQANLWKMAFCSNASQIAMVTNLQEGNTEKSSKYWPDLQEQRVFNDVAVTCLQEEEIYRENSSDNSPFIVSREIEVEFQSQKKRFTHFHMVNWMDNKVISPEALSELVSCLQAPSKERPLIVHCTAGIGRTGTLLATQHLFFKQIQKGERVKRNALAKTLSSMRQPPHGRAYMVGTRHQYTLIWRALEKLAVKQTMA